MTNDTTTRAGADPAAPTEPLADETIPAAPLAQHGIASTLRLPSTGHEIVLLDRDPFSVYSSGSIQHLPADTLATPIGDPQRRLSLLTETVRELTRLQQAERRTLVAGHSRTLDAIRTYAIERHRDGDICQDGLNRFLRAFGLAAYEPRVRVTFTITGSYEVEGTDTGAARSDGRSYLRLDTSDVDGVISDSLDYSTHVTDCDLVDD